MFKKLVEKLNNEEKADSKSYASKLLDELKSFSKNIYVLSERMRDLHRVSKENRDLLITLSTTMEEVLYSFESLNETTVAGETEKNLKVAETLYATKTSLFENLIEDDKDKLN